jgi:ABC-type transport system substrate-binding protein
LELEDAIELKKDPTYSKQLQVFPRAAIWYIGFNLGGIVPQFKDVRVRQAFSLAIDKDNIISNELGGIDERADGILPPPVFGHRDNMPKMKYDPAEAQKLLAECGYPGGKGFPELTMYYRDNRPDIKIVAGAVGQDLKKNLGVTVNFKPTEWGAYLELHDAKKIPFLHMRWSADYLDAQNFLSTLLATTGNENKIYYHNPQFDALCAAADSNQDPNERLKLYAQAEDIVLKELPFIPIYFEKDAELISPRVHGLRTSVFGHLPHTKVSVN